MWVCKICGKTFGTRKMIRRHIIAEHKKVWREDIKMFKKNNPALYRDNPRKERPHVSDYYKKVVDNDTENK